MKIGIISQISSDLHGFVSFLNELAVDQSEIKRIINLGDFIGSGIFTNYCLDIARFICQSYFSPGPVEDKVIVNCLKLGGITSQDAQATIMKFLKNGVIMHSLIGRQDLASFNREFFRQFNQKPVLNIKHENLLFLLWHRFPGTQEFINRMRLNQNRIPEGHYNLDISFAYGSWHDSYGEQIESYKHLTNQLADAGEHTFSLEKRIKRVQTIINDNFSIMKHWRTIMFIGGCPEALLFYKKAEQSQQWFVYEEPVEPGRRYSIDNNCNYIVTVPPLGRQSDTLEQFSGYIVLDIPEQTDQKPTFTLHPISLSGETTETCPSEPASEAD